MEPILIYLAKSVGLLTVFYISYVLLLNKDTNFYVKRKYLLAGILTSAILPALYFTKTIVIQAQPTVFSSVSSSSSITAMPQEEQLSLGSILAIMYFIGIAVMLVRFAVQLYSLYKLIAEGDSEKKNNIHYVKISQDLAPFSFLNYIVYNPKLHNSKDLTYILEHEKVHTRQWHSVDVLLSNFNLIVQWFNPFAWFYNKKLQENLEFLADCEAAKAANCKKEYQKTLLKISVNNFTPALTNNFYQSFIKKRIVMLNNTKKFRNTGWKIQLIIPVLLAFVFIFNVKTIAQINSNPTEYPQDPALNKVEISAEINKNSNKKSLEITQKLFQKRGIELQFENLKYSSEGLLTGITVRFLNKKTNQNGSYSKQNNAGIPPFEVYVNEENETGFREVKNVAVGTVDYNKGISLEKIGKNPLYILNGKTYKAKELYGKTISTPGQINVLIPEYAIKQYGKAAKDGALIAKNAKILDNFDSELKRIDKENPEFERNFIEVKENSKPVLMHMRNTKNSSSLNIHVNPNKKVSKVNLSSVQYTTNASSENAKQIKTAKTMGNPLIFIDGKMQKKDFKLESLNPEDIAGISVVGGDGPLEPYGEKAKDGLVMITTKKAGNKMSRYITGKGVQVYSANNSSEKSSSTWAERAVGNQDYYPTTTSTTTTNIRGEAKDENSNKVWSIGIGKYSNDPTTAEKNYKIRSVDSATNINASNIPNSTLIYTQSRQKRALIVVDGKIKKEDFNLNTIDVNTIESITALKDKKATDKYGKKGKNGVVEITTKSGK